MLIDTHAHIDYKDFDSDRDQIIERAKQAGVHSLIQIALGPDTEKIEKAYQLIQNHPSFYMAVGLHPHDADQYTPEIHEVIRSYLQMTRVVALGEIGLDYHYDNSERGNQRNCFSSLMDLAIEEKKPICIHTREAFDDTLGLTQQKDIFQKVGGVIHCFTGNASQAKAFLDLGAFISFSGIVTFPKATEIQDAVKVVPLDRILIETDCPFLAPVPYRGKRNEPSFLTEVAKTVASLKGISVNELAQITSNNAKGLFRLG